MVRLIQSRRLDDLEDLALPADPMAPREAELFEAKMKSDPRWRAAHDMFKDDPPNQKLSDRLSSPERIKAAKDIARLLSTHYTGRGGEDGKE
jgi:hypothetical protein